LALDNIIVVTLTFVAFSDLLNPGDIGNHCKSFDIIRLWM
jgi:hypothetical protein